jgi:hypothetical protein
MALTEAEVLAEWDERTWHVKPDLEINEHDPDVPSDPRNLSVIADRTGVLIFYVSDPGMQIYARSTADQYEAQRLADFLNQWIRQQRDPA